MDFKEINTFWFEETDPKQWWKKDEAFDDLIRSRFSEVHKQAARCELFSWRESPRGRLAEVIVLDQFSRNIYRDQPGAFAQDALALALSQAAINRGADQDLNATEKAFLYMPFMHSESPKIHAIAITLYSQDGLEYNLDFEKKHKAIIDRFGRYPHRNAILGRESTSEELGYLKQPGSGF